MKEVRKVHVSYVESPSESWVVADGGRCYKEAEDHENFCEMVRCPECPRKRWFISEQAYRQHGNAVHKDG